MAGSGQTDAIRVHNWTAMHALEQEGKNGGDGIDCFGRGNVVRVVGAMVVFIRSVRCDCDSINF